MPLHIELTFALGDGLAELLNILLFFSSILHAPLHIVGRPGRPFFHTNKSLLTLVIPFPEILILFYFL